MHINDFGKGSAYYQTAQEYFKENGQGRSGGFSDYVDRAGGEGYARNGSCKAGKEKAAEAGTEKDIVKDAKAEEESWKEKMQKWDEEMKRIREENRRERERLQEERIRKKRIQKKLLEKLALKKYLARQDEIMQMNEKISLERAVGEDVYIEKPPLSTTLSAAEIMAICSKL